jgi:hypothetical protein
VDGVQIPAALTLPEHGPVACCIVLISGSYFDDIDGN